MVIDISADSLPFSTNFTWPINENAIYNATNGGHILGHEFIFQLQIPSRSLVYTSYPFTIDGVFPTSPPSTTSISPSSTASAPPGHLETNNPQRPDNNDSVEKGLIATAIVLGAAVIIGAAMAFIFRHTLKRKLGIGKKRATPATDAGQAEAATQQAQVAMREMNG